MQKIVVDNVEVSKSLAEDIPVLYLEPERRVERRKLAIFLTGLGGKKEQQVAYLRDMARRGYVALSFDNYQHGERGKESSQTLCERVFSNVRKYGWPILGQTVLDTMRVIDWAQEALDVAGEVYMGGISMGGDITIAAAGVDKRIARCAPVICTPDWLRPGMCSVDDPEVSLTPGKPDSYAQFFYDCFDPMTHLEHYKHCPPMRMVLGAADSHIPPICAERFRRALAMQYPMAAKRIEIRYVHRPEAGHREVMQRRNEWWPSLVNWWLGEEPFKRSYAKEAARQRTAVEEAEPRTAAGSAQNMPAEKVPVPAAREEAPARAAREGAPVRDAREETPVHDAREETPVRDAREEAPVRDAREETPVRDAREKAPVRDAREKAPVRDAREEAPVRDAREEAPVRDAREETPARDAGKEASSRTAAKVIPTRRSLEDVPDRAPPRVTPTRRPVVAPPDTSAETASPPSPAGESPQQGSEEEAPKRETAEEMLNRLRGKENSKRGSAEEMLNRIRSREYPRRNSAEDALKRQREKNQ